MGSMVTTIADFVGRCWLHDDSPRPAVVRRLDNEAALFVILVEADRAIQHEPQIDLVEPAVRHDLRTCGSVPVPSSTSPASP